METVRKSDKYYKPAVKMKKMGGVQGLFANKKKSSLPLSARKNKKRIVRNVFLVLLSGVVLLVGYNTIKTAYLNSRISVKGNNFEYGNVFDDEDLNFDDSGWIVEDDTSTQDLTILKNRIISRFEKDAKKRCSDIEKIDSINSICVVPNNEDEKDNQKDKYMLSVIFNSGEKTYSLNYLTGKEFSSKQTIKKEFVGDFLTYIGSCATDTCKCMNEESAEIADLLGADFVGKSWVAYDKDGDEYYYVSAFNYGKNPCIYKTLSTQVDAINLTPEQALKKQLNGEIDDLFEKTEIVQTNTNLNNICDFIVTPAMEGENLL